jgi:predicted nucleic acid-binding protein
LALTENISHLASLYIEEFAPGSGLQLADALIAATAVEKSLPLVTGNVKLFKAIPGLQGKGFRH